MPNARDYRQAASRFTADAEHVRHLAAALARWPLETVAGGVVFDVAGERLGEVLTALRDAEREVTALADECRRRAVVCDAYAAEVDAFWMRPAHTRLGAVPPSPPSPWVSA